MALSKSWSIFNTTCKQTQFYPGLDVHQSSDIIKFIKFDSDFVFMKGREKNQIWIFQVDEQWTNLNFLPRAFLFDLAKCSTAACKYDQIINWKLINSGKYVILVTWFRWAERAVKVPPLLCFKHIVFPVHITIWQIAHTFSTHISGPRGLVTPIITSCYGHTQADVSFIAVCTVALCIYELQQAVCVNSDNAVFVQRVCVCVCFARFP